MYTATRLLRYNKVWNKPSPASNPPSCAVVKAPSPVMSHLFLNFSTGSKLTKKLITRLYTFSHWPATPWSYHAGTTRTPLAAHPRACQIQSGMPGSPVAVWAGASLPGRWLLPRVRQHPALSAVSWRSYMHGAANIQLFTATELLEPRDLACETLFRSSCAIQTSPTDCLDDSWRQPFFSGTMNTVLCDFWYAGAIKHLLTYLQDSYNHSTLLPV